MIRFLRESGWASYFLLVIRLYLGYEWMMAGWHKIADGFDASGYLKGALGKATGEHPAVQGWWASFIEGFALPNVGLFNFLVPWGELLVGIALILGTFTTFAALMAATMNFAFLLSGTTSTNPQMLLLILFVLVAGTNSGKIGLDRWLLPAIKGMFNKKRNHGKITYTN